MKIPSTTFKQLLFYLFRRKGFLLITISVLKEFKDFYSLNKRFYYFISKNKTFKFYL